MLSAPWLLGHLLVVAAVISFVLLGFWQLRRHEEKSDLRDAVKEGQALPTMPLAEAPEGSYRRVAAQGRYDPSAEVTVLRSRDGVSGRHVLTPLVLGDGTAVLVNRGWVGLDVDYRARGGAPPNGTVTVEGTLWPAEEGSSVPASLPEVVRRIDPEIQEALTPHVFREGYLLLESQDPAPGPLPLPPETPSISLGPHLGYAGQWFLFAGVVVVGYPLLLRRKARRD